MINRSNILFFLFFTIIFPCLTTSAIATCPYDPPISLTVGASNYSDDACIGQYQQYYFNANAGTTYQVLVSSYFSNDPDLYGKPASDVSNNSYDISSVTRGGGIGESLLFTASTSGSYYLAVYGYSDSVPTDPVDYLIRVEDVTPIPQLTVSRTTMQVGDSVTFTCDLGVAGAGRTVAFFVQNGSTTVATRQETTNSSGQATWTQTAQSDWQPSVSVQVRDETTSEVSSWENITVNTVTNNAPSFVPFYRLYKSTDDGQTVLRDHFYTSNPTERSNAIDNFGYKDEGIECYIANGSFDGSTPLFRLYKASTNSHYYTKNSAEKNQKISEGYTDEGIAGYVLPNPSSGFVPLYRLRQTSTTDDHYFLATKKYEYEAVKDGIFGSYEIEGEDIVGYVPPESLAKGRLQANRFGVDLASGHLRGLNSTGLVMKGKGLWLSFSHHYNSSVKAIFTPYPLGSEWSHNLESRIYGDPIDPVVLPEDRVPSTDVFLQWPDGSVSHFEKVGPGDSDYIDHSGRYDQLTRLSNGDEYLVTTKDQITYRYLRYSVNPWPGLDPTLWQLIDEHPLLLFQIEDWAGNTLTYNRDATYGRLESVADGKGRKLVLTYDSPEYMRLVNVKEEVGSQVKRTVSFGYDNNGKLSSFTDAEGLVTAYQYGSNNLLSNITYPRGNTVQIAYDSENRISSLQNSNDPETEITFNYPSPNTTTITDPNSKTFTYGHIDFQLTESPDIDNIEWDLNHLQKPKSITDKEQNTTTFDYDDSGNVIKVTNARGYIADYSYNERNNLTASTQFHAVGQAVTPTQYTYDQNDNRLTAITNPEGETVSLDYHATKIDQVETINDARGSAYHTDFTYDDYGNLKTVTDAESNLTEYQNDYAGRTTAVIDAKDNKTTHTYDNNDHPLALSNYRSDGINILRTINRLYDDNGNLEFVRWINQGTLSQTQYTYDDRDRLETVVKPGGLTQRLTYYENDLLHTRQDYNNQMTTYVYDDRNRLHETQYPDGSKVIISRNENGQPTNVTLDKTAGTDPVSVFTYDELNRIASYTDPYGKNVLYAYDEAGRLERLTYPNGVYVDYTYDNAGRLKTVTDWENGVVSYNYDAAGNLKGILRSVDNGATTLSKTVYTYDMASRLTGIEEKDAADATLWSYTYGLDEVGNHLSVDAVNEPLSFTPVAQDISYSNDRTNNRLLSAGATTYTYDNNGNRKSATTGGVTTTYSWDYENRLTGVATPGVSTVQHIYDGMGNRIARIADGTETRYVLDLNGDMSRVLAETDAAGNVTAYYVYGHGLICRIEPSGGRNFYHFNNRGDSVALSDDAGAITDRYAFDEYGKLMASTGTTENPFKFVGRFGVMAEGDDNFFMRARFYDAGIGKFLSEDSFGFGGGDWNLYSYANGNPLLKIDPDGTFWKIIYDAISATNKIEQGVEMAIPANENIENFCLKSGGSSEDTQICIDLASEYTGGVKDIEKSKQFALYWVVWDIRHPIKFLKEAFTGEMQY